MQFEYLQNKAKNGESFVVVGRCSEMVLRDYPSLVSIFILADMDYMIERTANTMGIKKTTDLLINYIIERAESMETAI